MTRIARLLCVLLLVPALLAAQNVAEVQVTPETVTLKVGQKQALFAAAFDANENLIPTARFTFTSNNPSVVTAQSDGVVIGLKAGAVIVQVSAGSKSFNVAVSVEGVTSSTEAAVTRTPAAPAVVPPAILTIEPSPIYLLPSENRRLVVKGFREDGAAVELGRVTWKSLTPETATVDGEGVIVGLAPGTAIIQVNVAGVAATAPVEVAASPLALSAERVVLAPGELDTLGITVPGQGNRELRTGLVWRSLNPEILQVGPTGIIHALVPGEAVVLVTGFFQERRVPVRIHPPVQSLVLSPKPGAGVIRMPRHGLRSLTVRAEAADSTPVPEAALNWEVGDTTVASYDPVKGEITARRDGSTTITLRTRGFDPISWVVEVIPGGMALDRERVALRPGDRLQLKGNLVDERGLVLAPAEGLEWRSDRITAAVVGNDGMVEATGYGRALLSAATPWGRSDTALVLVTGDLIFSTNRGGPTFGIYQTVTRDPGAVAVVLADSFHNAQPALSPDGTSMVFSSNRDGGYDLYIADADGAGIRRLTSLPGADSDPAWTPDGRHVVFTSTNAGQSQIYIVAAAGGEPRQLTTLGGGNVAPAVSPDGRTIAFVAGRDGNDDLYRMDLDGGNQVSLGRTREKEAAPVYLGDGSLVFATEVRRSGWQVVRMLPGDTTRTVLHTEPDPVTGIGVSSSGDRIAIVAGKVTDARRGRGTFRMVVIPATGGVPVVVPVAAGEQVAF